MVKTPMRIFFLIIHLKIILISCSYKFEEPTYIEVEEPRLEALDSIVFADTINSLYIYQPTQIFFDIDLLELETYELSLKIDGKTESLVIDGENIFYVIDPKDFDHGDHTATLGSITSTNSGSLADKVGSEVFILEKEFKFFIDLVPPEKIEIDSSAILNGVLNLYWNLPEKINYQKLILKSAPVISNGNFSYSAGKYIELEKFDSTFIDIDYNGLKIKYRVDIVGYNYKIEGQLFDQSAVKALRVKAEFNQDSTLFIEWDSVVFYNSSSKLTIANGQYVLSEPSVAHQGNFNYKFDMLFGLTNGVELTYKSNFSGYGYIHSYYMVHFIFFLGEIIPDYYEIGFWN